MIAVFIATVLIAKLISAPLTQPPAPSNRPGVIPPSHLVKRPSSPTAQCRLSAAPKNYPESPQMPFVRLAEASQIAPEKSLAVEVEGKKLLIAHSKGAFHVVINKCSHAEEALTCGRIRGGWVACPIHGARFSLATGEALNPPAKEPIQTFPARVVDGWVEAEL
jgi:3-phenylpropionate/trans-cinnamate dioxygenase ferredoxin subunit